MRAIKYLSVVLLCLAFILGRQGGKAHAEGATELKLSILPLQCVVEVVDDGVQMVRRVMPRECEKMGIYPE